MLFIFALFVAFAFGAEDWACQEGRGLCQKRIMIGRRTSAKECAALATIKEPTANGVTWMEKSRKCWAEIGQLSVRNNGPQDAKFTACGVGVVIEQPDSAEIEDVAPPPPEPVFMQEVTLSPVVEKPVMVFTGTLVKKGNGGCSCKGERYCRTGYKQWKDLTKLQCKDKAIEIGAKALEYSAKYGCMTHMSVATGSNNYPGVECFDVVVPTPTLEKKGKGGCSCEGEKYCRTGYKQYPELTSMEECGVQAIEMGAKAMEFSTKHGCMTHMSVPTGGNNYPGVTCYEVVLKMPSAAWSEAFSTSNSQGPDTNRTWLVNGFALLGLGALLYGAGKHYLGK